MILAYRILSNIFYPLLVIFIFFRRLIKKEDPVRFKEKILSSHFNVKRKKNYELIWFHAASIGEFKSIIPLLENLNNNSKNFKFLITTTTLSSGNLAENLLKKFDNVEHRFFPLDVDFLIKKFISAWVPDKIFLVDSEIWPNLIISAKKFKIPIALINARLSAICFFITPDTSSPTLIINNLAMYKDNPFPANATTIKIGISQDKVVFFSIKIFFTAGSSNQAIAEVLPATTIDSKRAKKIFFKCFFTYSL